MLGTLARALPRAVAAPRAVRCMSAVRHMSGTPTEVAEESAGRARYEPVYHHLTTKAVQSGESGGRVSMVDCLTTPIAQTSAYTFKDTQQLIDFNEDRYVSFEYGRYGNPTTKAAEDKLAALEGGEDCLFSTSSCSTNSTVLLSLVPPGGHVMTTKCVNRNAANVGNFLSSKLGATHSWVDQSQMDTPAIVQEILDKKPDVFFADAPSLPFLRVLDLAPISAACKEVGCILVVDSTLATPINMRTIELGADLVTHSASSYLGGHNDVLAGAVVGKKELVDKVRKMHAVLGGVLDPHAAYLVIRGVKTLGIRVEHQNKSALDLASYLSSVPQVEQVFYPGLNSHPDYDVARSMNGHGGVVSFVIRGGQAQARAFVDALRIPYIGPAIGGVESLVEMPSIAWGLEQHELHELGVPPGLVTFSCGLEDTVDLLTDVARALRVSAS